MGVRNDEIQEEGEGSRRLERRERGRFGSFLYFSLNNLNINSTN